MDGLHGVRAFFLPLGYLTHPLMLLFSHDHIRTPLDEGRVLLFDHDRIRTSFEEGRVLLFGHDLIRTPLDEGRVFLFGCVCIWTPHRGWVLLFGQ